ncbi:MAG: multidrug transporter CflA [Rhodospirillales bacterium 69-11]|nr:multidrug effflux MFS transporter [Rhodospirillales bacterium]OJW28212.1 MAG: multidrug transporter CflA [Rhodospirillales bacterium 69-11]
MTTASDLRPGARHVPRWLPPLLGFFIAVGPAATDMYLPAFPAVEATFGTEPGTAQLTLAAWFAGLAVGQITQGTLSDRFGRRRPMIFGMLLFTLATIGCALAPGIGWLAVFRAVAAMGGSAGMVIGRATVRDLADGHQAAVIMSRLMLVMGVAPILAPSIGGLLLIVAHWRVIFWVLAAYGAISTLLAWRILPETLPPDRRIRLTAAQQLSRYLAIIRERGFLTHAAMGGSGSFCMFAYLAGSAPVFIQGFGLSPSQFALIFGLCSCGLIAGSQINARLLPRFGLSFMLRTIARISLAATTTLLVLAFSGVHVLALIVAPVFVALSCQGFSNGNTAVGALSRHSGHAGSASALMGMAQFSLGASSGLLVGLFTDGTPRGMAALMFCGSLGAVIADLCRPKA